MWWIFGLINVIIVILFAWFFDKKIKENERWTLENKCAFIMLLLFAFLSGFLGSLLFVGIFVCLIIDFVKYTKNKGL